MQGGGKRRSKEHSYGVRRKCDKKKFDGEKLWLFRKRKDRHNNVDTPPKIFWALKILSLTLCDGECPPSC